MKTILLGLILLLCVSVVFAQEDLKINMIVPAGDEIIIVSPMNEVYTGVVNISWMPTGAELYQIQYTANGYSWTNLTTTTETEYSWNAPKGKYSVRIRGFKDGAWGGYQSSGNPPATNYSDVLVLWTNNDKGSEEVANYYIQEMNIPLQNKCYISINQGHDITKAQHEQLIQQIRSCISSTPNKIKFVVFTRGMVVGYNNNWVGNPTKKSVDATMVYALHNASYYKMYSSTTSGEPNNYVNTDFYLYDSQHGFYKNIYNYTIQTKKNLNWEDSYVRGGSFSNNNYGFEQIIVSKLSSNITISPKNIWSREAYIKIYEPAVVGISNGDVSNAKLHLFIKYSQSPVTLRLYSHSGLWSEKTLNNNNKPTQTVNSGTSGNNDGLVAEVLVLPGQQEVVFDITNYVKNNYFSMSEPLSFKITNDEDKVIQLWSSDSPWNTKKPYLDITYGKELLAYGRLDGWSIDEAKALVDKSKNSWGKSGLVVLDQGSGQIAAITSTSTYGGYETSLNQTANIARSYGYDVVFNNVQAGEPQIYITEQKAVSFLASWGSNDPVNPFNSASYVNNTWVPGAIVETAVSTSASTVTNKPVDYNGTQSKIADMTADGASGARGSVAEPRIYGVSRPHILFDAYVKGNTMGESYLMAAPRVLWEDLVLGDPKMAPHVWSPFVVK